MPTTSTADAKRSHVVAVRLSDDERNAWTTAAAEDGRRQLGRWVRERVALTLNNRANTSGVDFAEVARLRRELTAAGNNLNQLAREVNSRNELPADFAAKLAKASNSHRRLLTEVRDELRRIAP